jgi:hypothetical protein
MEVNMARTTVIGILVVLIIALVACGGGQASTTAGASDTGQTGATDFSNPELPLSAKLPAGTLMLEGTSNAVTPAQAQELLPLWQMLRALQESGTASEVEVQAVYDQIQAAMTPEQLAAIEGMSPEDMRALFEELGMGRQGESDNSNNSGSSGRGEGRTFVAPPDMGMMPPGAGGEGSQPGMGPGGFGNLSPEERATAMAGRSGTRMGFSTGMTDAVIELLQTRAAESSSTAAQ